MSDFVDLRMLLMLCGLVFLVLMISRAANVVPCTLLVNRFRYRPPSAQWRGEGARGVEEEW